MDSIAQLIGLNAAELTQLAILGVVLIVGLFILRTVMKLTATIYLIGCFGVIFIVAAVFLLQLFGN